MKKMLIVISYLLLLISSIKAQIPCDSLNIFLEKKYKVYHDKRYVPRQVKEALSTRLNMKIKLVNLTKAHKTKGRLGERILLFYAESNDDYGIVGIYESSGIASFSSFYFFKISDKISSLCFARDSYKIIDWRLFHDAMLDDKYF